MFFFNFLSCFISQHAFLKYLYILKSLNYILLSIIYFIQCCFIYNLVLNSIFYLLFWLTSAYLSLPLHPKATSLWNLYMSVCVCACVYIHICTLPFCKYKTVLSKKHFLKLPDYFVSYWEKQGTEVISVAVTDYRDSQEKMLSLLSAIIVIKVYLPMTFF